MSNIFFRQFAWISSALYFLTMFAARYKLFISFAKETNKTKKYNVTKLKKGETMWIFWGVYNRKKKKLKITYAMVMFQDHLIRM